MWGRRLHFATLNGRAMGLLFASRIAATISSPSLGFHLAGEPRKRPVQANGLLRFWKMERRSRMVSMGTAVSGVRASTTRTPTRHGKVLPFQMGEESMYGSDVTSRTPIQRESPVR